MADMDNKQETDEILGILRPYHAAMVAARTDQLAVFVDSDYSLAHITGYVQPRVDSFDVIRTRQFDYHRIDIEERLLSLSIGDSTARIAGRGIFDATINGMHLPWRLQSTMSWTKQSVA